MKKYLKGIIPALIILLLLDVFNIPGKLHIHLNYDAWNAIVVLLIALITYLLIDGRNERRKNNQEEIARTILKHTYSEVDSYMKMMDTELFLKAIPKRFPGDEYTEDNVAYQHLRNGPFIFESQIFELAGNGIVTAKQLQDYFQVKESYSRFLTNYITFYDQENMRKFVKSNLEKSLKQATKGTK